MDKNVLKTGTTTVGLVYKDGIVLAADKRATAGSMVVGKDTMKVVPLNDRMAVTIAGTVSEVQMLIKYIKAELKLKDIRTNRPTTVKEAANLISSMVYGAIRTPSMIPGIVHFLFGGKDNSGIHLYDLFPDGSITEIKDYISSGSGSVFAYGVLEDSYKHELSEKEAIDIAVRAVNAAVRRDTASGEGVNVFVIDNTGVREALQKTIETTLIK